MTEYRCLHLMFGGGAAGCVRQVIHDFFLPGDILFSCDDLCHGPLHDVSARNTYLRRLGRVNPECFLDILMAKIRCHRYDEICIWAGDNVSETLFLASICQYLVDFLGVISHIVPIKIGDWNYIAMQTPSVLFLSFKLRGVIDDDKRIALSKEFSRLQSEKGQLRRWEQGRISTYSCCFYDQFIYDFITDEWTIAANVVGAVMRQCDNHNLLDDSFVTYRLQLLIDRGCIEYKGGRDFLRDFVVRRSNDELK